jgi:hypothetical protein
MTARADVTAATGSRAGPRCPYLSAGSQAGLPAHLSTAGRDPRMASHRIDTTTATTGRYQQMTTLTAVSASTRLDAGGTTWRLRSLIAMGHDSSRIARALNVPPKAIQQLVRGDTPTVSPEFRDLACQLWNAWWDKCPPETTHAQRRAASAARRRAELSNWPAAAGLDEDELDEPGYRPFSRYRPATGTSTAPGFRQAPPRAATREIA